MFPTASFGADCIAFSSEWIINRYCMGLLLEEPRPSWRAQCKDGRSCRVSTARWKKSWPWCGSGRIHATVSSPAKRGRRLVARHLVIGIGDVEGSRLSAVDCKQHGVGGRVHVQGP